MNEHKRKWLAMIAEENARNKQFKMVRKKFLQEMYKERGIQNKIDIALDYTKAYINQLFTEYKL